jgi:hypothetical protein
MLRRLFDPKARRNAVILLVLDEGLDGPASELFGINAGRRDLAAESSDSGPILGLRVEVLEIKEYLFTLPQPKPRSEMRNAGAWRPLCKGPLSQIEAEPNFRLTFDLHPLQYLYVSLYHLSSYSLLSSKVHALRKGNRAQASNRSIPLSEIAASYKLTHMHRQDGQNISSPSLICTYNF